MVHSRPLQSDRSASTWIDTISFPCSIQGQTRVINWCELGIREAKVILAGPAEDPHHLPSGFGVDLVG